MTSVLPTEIAQLYRLESSLLNFNSFIGSIPPEFFNISTLQFLDLGENSLSGGLPTNLCYGSRLLQGLFLNGNNLSGAIPNSLSNCARLTTLALSHNKFNGFVPHFLSNLSFLEILDLSSNDLRIESSTTELSFITSLTKCRSLKFLAIADNSLYGNIPSSFGNFSSSLQYFYAYSCKIKGSIPDCTGNLSNLITLSLFENELSGNIPLTLKYLHKLQGLSLDSNNLDGLITESLCDLHMISLIFLSQNQLSGSIPECFGNVTSLRELHLNSNKLNSSIPSSFWGLTDLLVLDLSGNSLSGILPPEMGDLVAITSINLAINRFSETIPTTIGKLQNLIYLSLAHNRLKGSIPVSVGNMISLSTLDLSYNNFSGLIPQSLETLKHLDKFNVCFNALSGEIPVDGPFKNFTAESFKANQALCGIPKFDVPPCHIVHHRRKIVEFTLFILVGVVALIMVFFMTFIFISYKQKSNANPRIDEQVHFSMPERISYYEILQSTEQFNESSLLGIGSFGSVYRGFLRDGKVIAVKVFNLQTEAAFRSFDVECEVLRNIRHRNLAKVISSCSNKSFKAIILEYMPNGNLEKWLYSHNYCLDVMQRLNIMIDVASALEYLHHGSAMPIVHCDLKPNNVLLDDDMVAHVCDFGIAKILGDEESTVQTKTLATLGYIAPEYGLEGQVSTRCDVYSYGVMLMEIFTRKKPSDNMFGGGLSLKSWVECLLPQSPHDVIDPNLLHFHDEHLDNVLQCTSSILELALKCSAESPRNRIDINEALLALHQIKRQFRL